MQVALLGQTASSQSASKVHQVEGRGELSHGELLTVGWLYLAHLANFQSRLAT